MLFRHLKLRLHHDDIKIVVSLDGMLKMDFLVVLTIMMPACFPVTYKNDLILLSYVCAIHKSR